MPPFPAELLALLSLRIHDDLGPVGHKEKPQAVQTANLRSLLRSAIPLTTSHALSRPPLDRPAQAEEAESLLRQVRDANASAIWDGASLPPRPMEHSELVRVPRRTSVHPQLLGRLPQASPERRPIKNLQDILTAENPGQALLDRGFRLMPRRSHAYRAASSAIKVYQLNLPTPQTPGGYQKVILFGDGQMELRTFSYPYTHTIKITRNGKVAANSLFNAEPQEYAPSAWHR
ncbi:MAG: hypothetical protein HY921_09945 [Elusimicrobia bacterium]|nr:hypothetical protein [Elusimicrobiota bacterium]